MTDIHLATIDTRHLVTPAGLSLEYDRFGTGPPLVLVHGSFFNQRTNWQLVAPQLAEHFTVYALARRGRGKSAATEGHSMQDEAEDVAALIDAIDDPVHLLGHSFGAQVALAAAALVPGQIVKLVLYEPPLPGILSQTILSALEEHANARDWEGFTASFLRQVVSVTEDELSAFRASPVWPHLVADAPATQREFPALLAYDFDPARFAALAMPVMLQVGTETQGAYWATDALAAVLPDARIARLPGQGHDAMFTAPDLYARQVIEFLRG